MKLQAYDPTWAFHSALRAKAARWQRQQLLSAAQLANIEAAYPLNYYRPAWPLRVGLFLFTLLGLSMSAGFWFVATNHSPMASGALYCVMCFGGLELLIQERRFYRAGVDNAMLYTGLAAAIGLITYGSYVHIWPAHLSEHFTLRYAALPLIAILILLLAATLRYADALVTAVAFVPVLLLVILIGSEVSFLLLLLPFLAMGVGTGALILQQHLTRRLASSHLADYYATCLLTLKVLGLAILYLGGNYLVIREGYAAMKDLEVSGQVPLAFIFYVLTALIPFLYIGTGLRRADRTVLLMGLLTLAFSLYTLRHYRSLLPPEIAAVAAGVVLTVAAGGLLRWLRPARFGFTSLPDDEPQHFDLENLIQAQTTQVSVAAPAVSFEFGGGQSGGGGATGAF
jgi:hypothetical protein